MASHLVATSPFLELDNPLTTIEVLKLVFMFPLAIIRLVFIVLVLIVLAVVSSVASLGADFSKPFPPWRRAIVHLLRPLAKCVVWGLGYSVTVYGWENYLEALRRDVKLMVFNHPGWLDTVLMLYLFAPSGVSRAANNRIPVVGTIIRSFQNISVPRAGTGASRDSENPSAPLAPRSTTSLMAERLEQQGWPPIAVAPEGMTHNGKQLLKFRSGAFIFGAPVLPICISYPTKPLNPAWTIQCEPWHLLRILCQLWSSAHVKILPMCEPTAAEAQDPALFAETVRSKMAQALTVPLSPLSARDHAHVMNAGIYVNWKGKLHAPEGSIDAFGNVVIPEENQTQEDQTQAEREATQGSQVAEFKPSAPIPAQRPTRPYVRV